MIQLSNDIVYGAGMGWHGSQLVEKLRYTPFVVEGVSGAQMRKSFKCSPNCSAPDAREPTRVLIFAKNSSNGFKQIVDKLRIEDTKSDISV